MRSVRLLVVALLGAFALAASACAPPPSGDGNVAPIALANGSPLLGQAPLLVFFSSAGSTDTDGVIESYSWNFGDGSAPSNATNPSHTFTTGGVFTVTLTVTDDGGATASNSINVIVEPPDNIPPVASIGADTLAGKTPLTVEFDSDASTDPDGSVVSWFWSFGDSSGLNATTPSATHVYEFPGTYVATLTVTDNNGAVSTDSTIVTVTDNLTPTAAPTATPTSGKVPFSTLLSGSGSTDTDGEVVAWDWDFGDGSTGSGENVIHTFTAVGSYDVELTVTDDSGGTDTGTVTVVVDELQAPTAVANASIDAGKAPLGVIFSSAGTGDTDGTVVGYSWDFGDGTPTSSAANPSHLYANQGLYTATLTVTDDDGLTNTTTVSINVGPPNASPTAAGTATPNSGKSPLLVQFAPTGTADADGTIVSYLWNFGDGSPTSTDESPTHTYTELGTYTALLTVTDDNGATSSKAVPVAVVPNQGPTAGATATPSVGREPLTVALSSAPSVDLDGAVTACLWEFGDGTADSTDCETSHDYVLPGTYTTTLTVSDEEGETDSTTVTITVNPNQAPTAVANANFQQGNTPFSLVFDSSASVDADGTIVSYLWDFGDGSPTSTEASPAHVYDAIGVYTATLTVTDDLGATGTTTIDVEALDPYVYVRSDGDDAASGYSDAPKASITAALAAAVAGEKVGIRVAGGDYTGFTVVDGVDVIGGYDQDFVLGGPNGSTTAVVTGDAGSPGVLADGVSELTTISGLRIVGGGGEQATGVLVRNGSLLALDDVEVDSGEATGAGSSAYAVRTLSGSEVAITDSSLVARNGSQGVQGATGSTGGNGANGIASTGNPLIGVPPGGVSAGGSGLARSGRGADGAQNILGSAQGKVGEKGGVVGTADGGGAGGSAGSTGNPWGGGGGGAGSTSGAAGAAGEAGAVSLGAVGATFSGVAGGVGGTGGTGAGGGGGGSGAANSTRSGAGGSGGVGGNGGTGGQGGLTGGGSFASYTHDATVTISDSTLTTGTGGQGGTGGTGGQGGNGGNGGTGMSVGSVGGGGGGGGAAGGRGGTGGGGGAGGPSVGAYHVGSGGQTVTGLTTAIGAGGPGGVGGAGGPGGNGGAGGAAGTGGSGRNGFPGSAGSTGLTGGTGTTGSTGTTAATYQGGAANLAPVAVATGTPTSGKGPLTVTFDSSASSDADGTIVSYSWDFGDGSPTSTEANPTHTYAVGTYTAELTVTDDQGVSVVGTVTISSNPNQAPTAVANATPDAGKAPLGVTFSSAGSTDPDDSVAGYSWDFGDGAGSSTDANPSYTYATQGLYTATLTVTDQDGATDSATVSINVGPPNVAPVAAPTATPSSGIAPVTISFDGNGSSDADGTVTAYSWDFGDGAPAESGATASHLYSTPGTYTAVLTVTDDDGTTGSTPVTIEVAVNQLPTAVASATPTTGIAPESISFDGSGSSDADGTVTAYSWDFGDGAPAESGATASHTYTAAGTYTATLTVTDDKGGVGTDTVTITVTEPPPPPE